MIPVGDYYQELKLVTKDENGVETERPIETRAFCAPRTRRRRIEVSSSAVRSSSNGRETKRCRESKLDSRAWGGAWIHERAQLAENVVIEPTAVVGADVVVGAGTWVGSGAVLRGPTRIGVDNEIHPTAVLGGPPQDISYKGELTRLEIGDRNVIREGVTIEPSVHQGRGRHSRWGATTSSWRSLTSGTTFC